MTLTRVKSFFNRIKASFSFFFFLLEAKNIWIFRQKNILIRTIIGYTHELEWIKLSNIAIEANWSFGKYKNTNSFIHTHFLVVQIVHVPRPQVLWWLCVPHVHVAQAAYVRWVLMFDEAHDLFARQLERVEFVQEAKGSGHNATTAHTSHPTTHARETGGATRALLPRLQMIHLFYKLQLQLKRTRRNKTRLYFTL